MAYYNTDFLYISLILLGIIAVHYFATSQNTLVGHSVFQLLLGIGILDVALDIASCKLIDYGGSDFVKLSYFITLLFFLCQCALPYIFLLYTTSVRSDEADGPDRLTRFLIIPPIIIAVLILFNPLTNAFFYFDGSGAYYHGSLNAILYVQVFAFILIILLRMIRDRIERKEVMHGFAAYFVIIILTMIAQLSVPGLMTTGLGIGLGTMVLYINVSSPNTFLDYKTRLFNSRGLMTWLARRHTPCCAVMIEFPKLSKLNQIYGLPATDAFLQKSAEKVISLAGAMPAFRISNSKFIFFCETRDKAIRDSELLKEFFSEPISAGDTTILCTVKLCVADIDAPMLKNHGTMEYCSYLLQQNKDIHTSVLSDSQEYRSGFLYEQEIERYLVTAVNEDLFEIYMQPIYSMEKNRFTSVEVLSRLKHPTLGMISPELFIGIAERTGSIDHISMLQFNRLCRFLKANPDFTEKLDGIKFNLSPHELIAHNYGAVLPGIINQYGLPTEKFEFEITETAAIDYSSSLQESVNELTSYGIRLNMDDFGSGYANISNVLKIPFSCIKLDRSLLLDVSTSDNSAIFYHDMIDVLHKLGYNVLAEGVETKAEFEMLKDWGIDMIQGYYFSKPLPVEQITEMFI